VEFAHFPETAIMKPSYPAQGVKTTSVL